MRNLLSTIVLTLVAMVVKGQDLQLNDREYFERQGVNAQELECQKDLIRELQSR